MKKLFFMFAFVVLYVNAFSEVTNITAQAVDSVGPDGIPALIDVIRSTDPADDEIRIKALRRLGELNAKEWLNALLEELETVRVLPGGREVRNWRIRIMAAKALAATGDEKASIYLALMLRRETDTTVKRAAAQALGLLGETARKREVLEIMHSELEGARDNGLVSDLCEALGKIGDKASFVYLLRVTSGPYLNYVKEVAQKGITSTKWDKPSVFEELEKGRVTRYNK